MVTGGPGRAADIRVVGTREGDFPYGGSGNTDPMGARG